MLAAMPCAWRLRPCLPPLPPLHHTQPDSHYLQENTVPTINLCFAGILLPALLACWLMFFYRVYRWEG